MVAKTSGTARQHTSLVLTVTQLCSCFRSLSKHTSYALADGPMDSRAFVTQLLPINLSALMVLSSRSNVVAIIHGDS